MMAALVRFQAEDGMWRQLIDYPDAWKETSATAMFGYALALGVRRGLLEDPAYAEAYRRAWTALAGYVGEDGRLSQVCAGTGQSGDAEYYLERPVMTGDLHGQAALLWFAAEMAGEERRHVSSSLSPKAMGRGTTRRVVEGLTDSEGPSTVLRTVPLPMTFAHRED